MAEVGLRHLEGCMGQHSASVSTGDAWAIRALVKAEGPVLAQAEGIERRDQETRTAEGGIMSGFIEWLEKLNEKDTKVRAVLRRSLAFDPGAYVPAYPYVEPFIKDEDKSWRREMYYLVAGLWAAHWREGQRGQPMSLGKACAAYQTASGSTSTERRFINYAGCRFRPATPPPAPDDCPSQRSSHRLR